MIRSFSICPGDLVIFSSRTIPGNERIIQYMMSLLERRGARIFSARNNPLIHVSGHGYRDELKGLLSALRPKYFVPVHGTFSHLTSNSLIPKEIGLDATRTFVIENGDVIDVEKDSVTISDRIDIDNLFVDSESYTLLPHETLRERLRIGELGLVVVALACDLMECEIMAKPQLSIHGLVPPNGRSMDDFEEELLSAAKKGFKRALAANEKSAEEIEDSVRVEVRRMLFQLLRKKPVVICQILPV